MAMPDRPGFFDAMIEGVGVSTQPATDKRPEKLLVTVKLYLAAMKHKNAEGEDEWIALHDYDWHITAFLFLQNNDGNVNSFNLDSVKRAFPDWNGWDFAALNDMDTTGLACRATLEQDTYNGNTQIKVRFLHAADYEGGGGGVKKADATEVKAIMSKFGSQFRALAAPAKPANAAPTKPAGLPPKPPTQAAGLPPVQQAAPAAEPDPGKDENGDDLPF